MSYPRHKKETENQTKKCLFHSTIQKPKSITIRKKHYTWILIIKWINKLLQKNGKCANVKKNIFSEIQKPENI